jgi:phosphatidylinositol-3-phosphatase
MRATRTSICLALVLLLAVIAATGESGSPPPRKPATSGNGFCKHYVCPPPASPSCGFKTAPPAVYSHVIWIWMENKAYGQIIGSNAAPYENQLASECGLATNYFAITHPSLPNYIAATSGSPQGITDDLPPSSHPLGAVSLFQQASSWRGYEESMPFNCDLGDAYPYAVKHNPAAYYTLIRTACGSFDIPMGTTTAGAFLNDLNKNTLPAFSFVTPDMCNDTHDCSVATGDSWLQSWVPKIVASPAYQSGNTALFTTWDEDDLSASNHVAMIVVSPYTPHRTQSASAYNHYSLLRTTEEMLGITNFLGNAATAASMRASFGL